MFEKWNFVLYQMYIDKKVPVKDYGIQFDNPPTDLNLTDEKKLSVFSLCFI